MKALIRGIRDPDHIRRTIGMYGRVNCDIERRRVVGLRRVLILVEYRRALRETYKDMSTKEFQRGALAGDRGHRMEFVPDPLAGGSMQLLAWRARITVNVREIRRCVARRRLKSERPCIYGGGYYKCADTGP